MRTTVELAYVLSTITTTLLTGAGDDACFFTLCGHTFPAARLKAVRAYGARFERPLCHSDFGLLLSHLALCFSVSLSSSDVSIAAPPRRREPQTIGKEKFQRRHLCIAKPSKQWEMIHRESGTTDSSIRERRGVPHP